MAPLCRNSCSQPYLDLIIGSLRDNAKFAEGGQIWPQTFQETMGGMTMFIRDKNTYKS